ncbi:hypothetical protein [Variovorax sp. ZT4R33]|uniref:hypothetical protein n=1 Tax=Variovorax sp. ZT4R33 TaxID=3443743 RepID=UPI003F45164A
MPRLLAFLPVLVLWAACAADDAGAQVVRCVDASGSVSYTDGSCARGDRRSDLMLGPEATQRAGEPERDRRQEQLDSVERATRLQRESVETVQRQSAPSGGSGLVVIDPRAEQRAQAEREQAERRQREAQLSADEPWRQGYAGGGYDPRPAAPPRDMRPRLRHCDAAGCRDNMGNHYDPKGNVDRFVRPDGRTCRPVNTTVVCQ